LHSSSGSLAAVTAHIQQAIAANAAIPQLLRRGPLPEYTGSMARLKRLQIPGLIRHVVARGNGRMRIFLDDADFREFTHTLGEVVERYQVHCWNYCIMPNHYHVTLQPTLPNLSTALRCLNGVYAQWWNRRHAQVGHVFQGRFRDHIVDGQDYLMALTRYVAMNPVRAGLVERPEDWPWSSYRQTVGASANESFVATQLTLNLFGDDLVLAQSSFAAFLKSNSCDETLVDRFRSNERVLGTSAFKAKVQSLLRSQPGSSGQAHIQPSEITTATL
jgi:putative transposase